jgi:proline dehydrogenase
MFKYVAGNKLTHAISMSSSILKKGKIPVINYAIESTGSKMSVFKEYENLYDKLNSDYRVALKLSSFNFDNKLTGDIIDMYKNKNIQILIDAEDNSSDNLYQEKINELLLDYNKDNFNIFKTYQMYRKDALDNLKNDINYFNQNNIFLGVKLVRGAYWNSEQKDGHLFTYKKDTDISYNRAIIELYENKKYNISPILATHNSESINLGQLLNNNNDYFEFGHLLGMKENKYAEVKGKINVYIPYGPYSKMIPYLGRRLFENLDTIKYIFN